MQWFWDVVESFDKKDLAILLQFVTGWYVQQLSTDIHTRTHVSLHHWLVRTVSTDTHTFNCAYTHPTVRHTHTLINARTHTHTCLPQFQGAPGWIRQSGGGNWYHKVHYLQCRLHTQQTTHSQHLVSSNYYLTHSNTPYKRDSQAKTFEFLSVATSAKAFPRICVCRSGIHNFCTFLAFFVKS